MLLNPDAEPIGFRQHIDGGEVPFRHGIAGWLMDARDSGATHMLVVCDEFDHGDYPVPVMPDQNVYEMQAYYDNQQMQRVMEVYWLDGDLDTQLAMDRAFVYGPTDN